MSKQKSKIFVTGAAGFIGSHLVEKLVVSGYPVKALVRYNSGSTAGWLDHLNGEIQKSIEIVRGDVRDGDFLQTEVKGCGIILHLASLISIPYSYHAPRSYIDTNVSGTLNVLQAALKNNCERVIHTSTSEVYGTAQYVPIDEKHPVNTQSPYSASKASADNLALSYFYSFELPVCVIRPFNTFGPRQSLRAVIPNAINQILETKDGTIDLGLVSPTRDFSYVGRTVQGFIQSLSSEGIFGKVINLGTGFEISIKDTVELISKILNKKVTIRNDEARIRPEASEVMRLYADISEAKKLLGLPAVSPLEEFRQSLEKTCEWFANPENKSKYTAAGYRI